MMRLPQGATWRRTWPIFDPVTGIPFDVTGCSLRAQVREPLESGTVLQEWSTATGNAQLIAGEASITLEPADSADWTWTRGVYDVLLTTVAGDVLLIAEGETFVDYRVTR